ncbi:hypothetical protein [Gemmata massiliana]|uniref:hypothetical protein n=1 Tax=Gemmata massiliana TaxID=1210884 RepID=UPI0013A6B345|nr:hypothetical protein [Gemmata massiliana]
MPTLEELLRASLKGANEKIDQANKDLHAAVVEAAKAVESVTEGKATLRLNATGSDESGTRYDLDVIVYGGGNEARTLSNLGVPIKGYPIFRYTNRNRDSTVERFDSVDALKAYFQKLASDADSPLVGYLAYVVRNPVEASTSSEVPF